MLRHVPVCMVLVAVMGCCRARAPAPADQAKAWDEMSWESDRRARSGAYDVARAAYYFMIARPERKEATLHEVVATRDDPEFIYTAAERAKIDPWGREVRLTFESPFVILATSAGPDGTFGTRDDVRVSTRGWQ